MPCATLNATAVVRKAPPVAISQPVRASARRRRVATARATMPPTSAKPSSQPACPPRPSLSSRSGPVAPPNVAPPPARRRPAPAGRRPGRRGARGRCSRGSATRMLLSLVPEIQGRLDGGRERHEQRPRAAHDDHRGAAGEQLAQRGEPAARRDPQPRRGDRRARPAARRPSSSRSRGRRRRPPARASACGRPRSARTSEPQRGDAAQRRAARRGCCGARWRR